MPKLNAKQERFCHEYLIDLNATGAAKRAGYSEKTAYSQGHDILKKPEAAQLIQELKEKRSQRTEITQDRVLLEFARIGFFDIRELFNENGDLKQVHELSDDAAAMVSSIEVDCEYDDDKDGERVLTGFLKKLRLWKKESALAKLWDHVGLTGPNSSVKMSLEHSGEVTIKDERKVQEFEQSLYDRLRSKGSAAN